MLFLEAIKENKKIKVFLLYTTLIVKVNWSKAHLDRLKTGKAQAILKESNLSM